MEYRTLLASFGVTAFCYETNEGLLRRIEGLKEGRAIHDMI
jgi:hypothetical protein